MKNLKYLLPFVLFVWMIGPESARAQTGEPTVQADIINFILGEVTSAAYNRRIDSEQVRRRAIVKAEASFRQEYTRRKIRAEQAEYEARREQIIQEQMEDNEYRQWRTQQEYERQRREYEFRKRYCAELAAKGIDCRTK